MGVMCMDGFKDNEGVNGVVLMGACLSLHDMLDAVADHGEEEDGYCQEMFRTYTCSRSVGHMGPCACATGPNCVNAVWEAL